VTIARRAASPIEVAARLWPPPDPGNYMKREIVSRLLEMAVALNRAVGLRSRLDGLVFPQLDKLWTQPTKLEAVLTLLQLELRNAERSVASSLYLLSEARNENDIRNLDERSRERQEEET
jgi:hypothetical protein